MVEDNKSDFDAFVKAQQKSAQDTEVDWDKERDEWLAHLEGLYKKIEEMLGEYVKSGQILLRYQNVQLNEEDIGTYSARRLIIKIGGKEIVLEPVGTLLIGTKGRVDVTGPAGSTRIMLVDKDATRPRVRVTVQVPAEKPPGFESPAEPTGWTWKLVTSPPTVRYIELTQDSLFRALLEVGGG
ncbi:MAG TPA: hypothetical protein VI653_28190 [Steroidobacteraceae bacterium]